MCLKDVANYDILTRQILGVHTSSFGAEQYEFAYQTIIDNVSLLDEEMLLEINQLVVKHGQILLKKKRRKNLY